MSTCSIWEFLGVNAKSLIIGKYDCFKFFTKSQKGTTVQIRIEIFDHGT